MKNFGKNAAKIQGTDLPCQDTTPPGFVQFSADNVDHKIRTMDGKDTFHGIGIIASITPGVKVSHPVHRLKVSKTEICGGLNSNQVS